MYGSMISPYKNLHFGPDGFNGQHFSTHNIHCIMCNIRVFSYALPPRVCNIFINSGGKHNSPLLFERPED